MTVEQLKQFSSLIPEEYNDLHVEMNGYYDGFVSGIVVYRVSDRFGDWYKEVAITDCFETLMEDLDLMDEDILFVQDVSIVE